MGISLQQWGGGGGGLGLGQAARLVEWLFFLGQLIEVLDSTVGRGWRTERTRGKEGLQESIVGRVLLVALVGQQFTAQRACSCPLLLLQNLHQPPPRCSVLHGSCSAWFLDMQGGNRCLFTANGNTIQCVVHYGGTFGFGAVHTYP